MSIDISDINNQTIFIGNDGSRLYTKYDFLLDVIKTNLMCYKKDFFKNKLEKFGSEAINMADKDSIQKNLEKILEDRLDNLVTIKDIEIKNGNAEVSLQFKDTLESIDVSLEEGTDFIHVYKLEN